MSKRLTPGGRRMTWRPDVPDHRDLIYTAPSSQLPSHTDLRHHIGMRPIGNQKNLGSCTGNAWGAFQDYLHPNDPNTSRLFIYYNERLLEGTVNQDAGAQIRTGAKVISKFGACDETLWPYKIYRYRDKPTKKAYAQAGTRRTSAYMRITTLHDLKASLAEGFPSVFGMSVYESFESNAVAFDGVVPMPDLTEACLGGHAVMAVGYDDASQRVIVRNSWGADWGDNGYFTLPYAYVSNNNLCDDFWTVRK